MPTKKVELHEQAAIEYDTAFDWYFQRSPQASLNFDAEVNRALEQIRHAPQRWAAGAYETRRYLLRKFPFVVVYRELSDSVIQVLALAHTSRKPGYWKERIEK